MEGRTGYYQQARWVSDHHERPCICILIGKNSRIGYPPRNHVWLVQHWLGKIYNLCLPQGSGQFHSFHHNNTAWDSSTITTFSYEEAIEEATVLRDWQKDKGEKKGLSKGADNDQINRPNRVKMKWLMKMTMLEVWLLSNQSHISTWINL